MLLMNDGVKRIAFGYTRVSTEEQTYGASLENQRLAIQKYANQNDIEIIGWYTDAGISAKTAHRPELQKMLADIAKRKGRIDHVVVYNVSRISRDTRPIDERISAARPKSSRRATTSPSGFVSTMMLDGLMSRWIICCSCA